jgi:hypothetical protein
MTNDVKFTSSVGDRHYMGGLQWVLPSKLIELVTLRATPHTRLSARDHYTSSPLIGGKGGAGPSSLHTTLKGPPEYVNATWM